MSSPRLSPSIVTTESGNLTSALCMPVTSGAWEARCVQGWSILSSLYSPTSFFLKSQIILHHVYLEMHN